MKYIKLFEDYSIFDIIIMTSEDALQVIVDEIYSRNTDVNLIKDILYNSSVHVNATLYGKSNLLILALHSEKKAVVELLLQHPDCDINLQTPRDKYTALMYASKLGLIGNFQKMLQLPQININIQNYENETALHLACFTEKTDVVELLLQHPDIDVNVKNYKNETALYFACDNGNIDIVELLLENPSIDVNVQSRNWGFTALHEASRKCYPEIVEALLQHPNIDKTIVDDNGLTAWDKAPSWFKEPIPELKP